MDNLSDLFTFLPENMDWLSILGGIKDFLLPITSLVFSSFAFYISMSERKAKKFNLKVDSFSPCEEWVVDRDSDDKPDHYFQNKYRILEAVLITNNSSLPVTITKFSIVGIKDELTPFTKLGKDYSVTIESPTTKLPSGVITYSGRSLKLNADLDSFPPVPIPFTLGPYESITTTLIFRYDNSLSGKNIEIKVHTSRGVKSINRLVSKSYTSQLMTDYSPPQLDKFE